MCPQQKKPQSQWMVKIYDLEIYSYVMDPITKYVIEGGV